MLDQGLTETPARGPHILQAEVNTFLHFYTNTSDLGLVEYRDLEVVFLIRKLLIEYDKEIPD